VKGDPREYLRARNLVARGLCLWGVARLREMLGLRGCFVGEYCLRLGRLPVAL